MQKSSFDVSTYTDYVTARIKVKYWCLPDYAKNVISVDDCVQDGLLYIHRVLNRHDGRKVKYDPSIGKITTLLYVVIESYFSHLLKTHFASKRKTTLIAIADLKSDIATSERSSSLLLLQEARDKVTRMHLMCPPYLIDFIHDNLYHPVSGKIRIRRTENDYKYKQNHYTKGMRKLRLTIGEIKQSRIADLKLLCKRYGVSADDYRLVLAFEK